jgi:hypothetical protein
VGWPVYARAGCFVAGESASGCFTSQQARARVRAVRGWRVAVGVNGGGAVYVRIRDATNKRAVRAQWRRGSGDVRSERRNG